MEPYQFATRTRLDDEKPVLPPKKEGECFRYMSVAFRDGKIYRGYNIFDVYMRALSHIGLEKAYRVAYCSPKLRRNGAPVISNIICKEWPERYMSVEYEGYHILKVKANTYRALLNLISETYNLGIKVELL